MTGFVEYLHRPVRILGEDIVFVPDIVGPVPLSEQHQYVELSSATNTCPAIHIRETDIEDIRESYPNTRVFGMWHTLINSGLVSYRKSLQVVMITPQDGYYNHCDLGRAEFSGDYEAGFFAADASFNLDEAADINPNVDQLVLPETEARLAGELLAKRKDVIRKTWSNLISIATLVIICGFSVNLILNKMYSIESEHIESKTELLQVLQSGLDKLKTTRLTNVPNNTVAIERIAEVWGRYPGIYTESNQSFKNKNISLVMLDSGENPGKKFEWLTSEYNPEGEWKIHVKVDSDER